MNEPTDPTKKLKLMLKLPRRYNEMTDEELLSIFNSTKAREKFHQRKDSKSRAQVIINIFRVRNYNIHVYQKNLSKALHDRLHKEIMARGRHSK